MQGEEEIKKEKRNTRKQTRGAKMEESKERTKHGANTEHFHSLPWKLYPNMWKSSAGIYALKTSGKEEEGGLRLSLFHCGIIMMIKSLLQSYCKQWNAHS